MRMRRFLLFFTQLLSFEEELFEAGKAVDSSVH